MKLLWSIFKATLRFGMTIATALKKTHKCFWSRCASSMKNKAQNSKILCTKLKVWTWFMHKTKELLVRKSSNWWTIIWCASRHQCAPSSLRSMETTLWRRTLTETRSRWPAISLMSIWDCSRRSRRWDTLDLVAPLMRIAFCASRGIFKTPKRLRKLSLIWEPCSSRLGVMHVILSSRGLMAYRICMRRLSSLIRPYLDRRCSNSW